MPATALTELTPATEGAPGFVDRHGIAHQLVEGHRDRLKPGWRNVLLADRPPATDDAIRRELAELASRASLAEAMLRTCGCDLAGRSVLVVGCGDVAEPLMLAGCGAGSVVGTDQCLEMAPDESDRLWRLAMMHLADSGRADAAARATIDLVTDDITASKLPDASFDVVCSWRTLEHVLDPEAAMREVYRLLRPGGFAYHEYNPFFAIDGGHSLVTLDLPWGHVRLDAEDVGRYLRERRPEEAGRALDFYHNCLNRMTIDEMSRAATAAGFETAALVPRSRTEDVFELTPHIFESARRNYLAVTFNDLVCRVVRVVLRRPCSAIRTPNSPTHVPKSPVERS